MPTKPRSTPGPTNRWFEDDSFIEGDRFNEEGLQLFSSGFNDRTSLSPIRFTMTLKILFLIASVARTQQTLLSLNSVGDGEFTLF